MRLIILSAHQRKMTKVMFNRDDDLIFTAAADSMVCVWDTETGERLGTYEGHSGAVFDIDVDYQSQFLLSAASGVRLWEVKTGKQLKLFKTPVRVSSVEWACGDKIFLATSPQFLRTKACIHIYNNPQSTQSGLTEDAKTDNNGDEPISSINIANDTNISNFSITKGVWSPLNDRIFALCSDNSIRIIDVEKGKQTKKVIFVNDLKNKMKLDDEVGTELTDFRYNKDYCTAVVCGRSKFAKMYDINRWNNPICTYECDRALNTIAIHPKLDMIAMGGGKTAQQAALTKKDGKYEALFYHKIFEQEIGRIQTDCFSPLNTMAWNSCGNQLCLGYEQGESYLFEMDVDFQRQFHKRTKQFISIQKDDSDSDNDDD